MTVLTNKQNLKTAYVDPITPIEDIIRAEPAELVDCSDFPFFPPTSTLEDDLCAEVEADAKRRRIYLSGPMKGYPESNYPMFMRVAESLRALGHDVYNPAEFPHDGPHETFPIRQAFFAYCEYICNVADTIVLLPGFEKSSGACAELALARNCGLEVIELNFSFDLFV